MVQDSTHLGPGIQAKGLHHSLSIDGQVLDLERFFPGPNRLDSPPQLIQCEVDFIEHLGVEIRLGVEIGKDITFADLRRDYDAIFMAPGCRRGRPGERRGRISG